MKRGIGALMVLGVFAFLFVGTASTMGLAEATIAWVAAVVLAAILVAGMVLIGRGQ